MTAAWEVRRRVVRFTPQPTQSVKSDKPGIGHGVEDLPREEQQKYRDRPATIIRVAEPIKQQNYVSVPTPDYLAEGYRRAIEKEVKSNESYRPLAMRLEQMAHHFADSLRTQERMFGT